jgi:hypothetical protein
MYLFTEPTFNLNLERSSPEDYRNESSPQQLVNISVLVDPLQMSLPFILSPQRINGYGGQSEMFTSENIDRFHRADQMRLEEEKEKKEKKRVSVLTNAEKDVFNNASITTSNLHFNISVVDVNSTNIMTQLNTTITHTTRHLLSQQPQRRLGTVSPYAAPDDRIYFYSIHYQGGTKPFIEFDACRRLVSLTQFHMERAAINTLHQALIFKHHHHGVNNNHHQQDATSFHLRHRRLHIDEQNTTALFNTTTNTIQTHSVLHAHQHKLQQRLTVDHGAFESVAQAFQLAPDAASRARVVYEFMAGRISDEGVQRRCREIFDKQIPFPKYSRRMSEVIVKKEEKEKEKEEEGKY